MARELSHRPPRDAAYHEDAIIYNEGMATRARELSAELANKEIKRWCRSIARQHDEHTAFHRKSLQRLEKQREKKKQQRRNKRKNKVRGVPLTDDQRAEVERDRVIASSRPVPRDPRLPVKTVFSNQPVAREDVQTEDVPRLRDAVGTDISADNKQEASE